ncbi:MAG TPA: CDP-alcohol phosphatidyltransferase family protein [Mycobacteriales bacterium]|jgi:CDP-diacylglycerol--glycerol-3-phosphate 3-phosphatidyltransferase|nr:CDP-alcohol phosphatidyltransferase family protein [Mycobacteriales bacterium]
MTRNGAYLLALAGFGVALVVLALVTARRPGEQVPSRNGYFDRWQELHGGYDPRTGSVWLRGWLSMVYAIARPLGRRGVQPDVVTISSIWLAALVLVLAEVGGRWWIAAGWVMVASGLFDTLDGCVAVLERRTTRWGYVLDSAVDRVNDAVYLLAVVAVGCPPELAVALGFCFFFLEYLRARAGNAGGDEVGRVTMAERPTRVILLSPSIHFSGVFLGLSDVLPVVGPGLLLAMTVVSIGQLAVTVRRQLLDLPLEKVGPD